MNDVQILAEDIDHKQFSLFNFNGKIYIVDESNEFPTRIKVLPGRSYRLNEGDFVNVGLEQDLLVLEASAKIAPGKGDDKNINIRYAEPGVSKILDDYLKQSDHIAEDQPVLRLEPMDTDLEEICEGDLNKEKNIGRVNTNDYVIEYEGVSRDHCKVYYSSEHGWMIKEFDKPAMSGTWLHLKNYFKAKTSVENSAPVLMHDGMEIKAHTYLFKFHIAH